MRRDAKRRLRRDRVSSRPYPCAFTTVTSNTVQTLLGGQSKHGKSSIFQRHGLTTTRGEEIKLGTHQLRHFLNTAAQRGGLSQIEIAKWSGRKDVSQNTAYNHMSGEEILDLVREAIGDDTRIVGPLAEIPENLPMSKEKFAELRAPTALTTDSGGCIHDWSMSPCPLHGHCIDCEEHIYKKTSGTREIIRTWCEQAEKFTAAAEAAVSQGYAGANRWLEKHEATRQRLRKLLSILEDPAIPDGILVHLEAAGKQAQ